MPNLLLSDRPSHKFEFNSPAKIEPPDLPSLAKQHNLPKQKSVTRRDALLLMLALPQLARAESVRNERMEQAALKVGTPKDNKEQRPSDIAELQSIILNPSLRSKVLKDAPSNVYRAVMTGVASALSVASGGAFEASVRQSSLPRAFEYLLYSLSTAAVASALGAQVLLWTVFEHGLSIERTLSVAFCAVLFLFCSGTVIARKWRRSLPAVQSQNVGNPSPDTAND